ncbi:ribosome modulation factor [Methylobacterium brachythecii]|uniref:Ribosome modulation factor n=1 Tax=Methylobacterium brachythecii TaxID=1176177 RepID=A0A7W6AL77_9HYPH|nr:Rmf/CrpP family protein [Methylobacterium brachythecii]MBB3905498.1 ribosome modulation factor [Methylobacterium brachythecii]GLS46810.1 hypothetical protein GCM10007884_48070 [Methylobacterium brachythecii]
MANDLDPKRRHELAVEGANVRASGRPKDACPYPLESLERIAWVEGFDGEPIDQGPDLPIDQT